MMNRTSICLLYSDTKKGDLFFTIFIIHRMSLWKNDIFERFFILLFFYLVKHGFRGSFMQLFLQKQPPEVFFKKECS